MKGQIQRCHCLNLASHVRFEVPRRARSREPGLLPCFTDGRGLERRPVLAQEKQHQVTVPVAPGSEKSVFGSEVPDAPFLHAWE